LLAIFCRAPDVGSDPRGADLQYISQDAGVPHSYELEISMKVELWAGITIDGRSSAIWIPMKRGYEGGEAEGGGFGIKDIKPYEDRSPVTSLYIIINIQDNRYCHGAGQQMDYRL
jgi:hypothetical protein